MVGIRDSYECYNGCSDRRTGNTHLRCNRCHTARALWADTLLQSDVADDRHQRVNHVSGTHQHREEECTQRRKERDVVGMLTQQLLSYLYQPVHTARCLHNTSTCNGCDDDVNNVGWRCAGFQSEAEHQDGQTDSRNRSQGQAAIARANPQCT